MVVAGVPQILEQPSAGDRAAQDRRGRQRIVLVMDEPSIQARLIAAPVRIRGEPGGQISAGGEEFGERGIGRVQGSAPSGRRASRATGRSGTNSATGRSRAPAPWPSSNRTPFLAHRARCGVVSRL